MIRSPLRPCRRFLSLFTDNSNLCFLYIFTKKNIYTQSYIQSHSHLIILSFFKCLTNYKKFWSIRSQDSTERMAAAATIMSIKCAAMELLACLLDKQVHVIAPHHIPPICSLLYISSSFHLPLIGNLTLHFFLLLNQLRGSFYSLFQLIGKHLLFS